MRLRTLLFGVAAILGLTLPTSAAEPDGFVVHEWGTFSTFSGSDGKPLKFTPNDTDLPAFVHNYRRYVKGGVTETLVSLETPVLYFYTDRDRIAAVHVDFPKGVMTDWYPSSSRPPSHQLRWDGLRILAKDRPTLAGERDRGRYFAAREVDAATVRGTHPDTRKPEYEKFLFYRGVGDFPMPLQVRAEGKGSFAIKNSGPHPVPGHFLIEVKDGRVTFAELGKLAAGAEGKVALPAEASTAEKLGGAVVKVLVEQGLYEKEARAMVKTWQADWFGEDGTRVLYLVAEPVTNELLPLKIDPKPDRLVRVLVGRHDVLTPEREAEVDALVQRFNGNSNADAKAADKTLNKLGRYRHAAQTAAEGRTTGRR